MKLCVPSDRFSQDCMLQSLKRRKVFSSHLLSTFYRRQRNTSTVGNPPSPIITAKMRMVWGIFGGAVGDTGGGV